MLTASWQQHGGSQFPSRWTGAAGLAEPASYVERRCGSIIRSCGNHF
jgi:hypothetical protein